MKCQGPQAFMECGERQPGPSQERPLDLPYPMGQGAGLPLTDSPLFLPQGLTGAKGEPGPMGIPGVKVSGLLGTGQQSRARVWEGLQERGSCGIQETPASEPLPLVLQGQPGLPGPPGLPVSGLHKGFEGHLVAKGDLQKESLT